MVRIACVPPSISSALLSIATPHDAVRRHTIWDLFVLDLSSPALDPPFQSLEPPQGFRFSRVPEKQLGLVIETSSFKRLPETLLLLPNMGLIETAPSQGEERERDEEDKGRLVAWAYVGVECSFATLYALPEFRGRGLATLVAARLLRGLRDGEFAVALSGNSKEGGGVGEGRLMAYDGKSGYLHADVASTNEGSKNLVKRLGGKTEEESSYIWVDVEKLP